MFLGAVSTANGSAMVKLGDTVVICGVKGEITVPSAEEPGRGMIGSLFKVKTNFVNY